MREAEPLRSFLFVPAGRPDRVRKAATEYGADAIIVDLEDAVPLAAKGEARLVARDLLAEMAGVPARVFVRLNGWATGLLLLDAEAVAAPALAGVFLAKARDAADVAALDRVLFSLEATRELPSGGIEIVPLPETAQGMREVHAMCLASGRVRRTGVVDGAAPGSDRLRSLGASWSPEGLETLYASSRTVLDARAAGVDEILCGPCLDLTNADLLLSTAMRAKALGATASMAIHPRQVEVINRVFTPTAGEIAQAVEVIEAFRASVARSPAVGVAVHRGRMIDYAHVRDALRLLSRAGRSAADVPALGPVELPPE